jgi:hypothetical protein
VTAAVSLLLLVLAAGALGHGAWRCAAALGAEGALRIVAAAPIAASAAVLSLLALGRIGLSGSPVAVVGVAVALGAAARARLPRRPSRWAPARRERLALGAALGLALAWTGWVLRNPGLGIDPLSYHLSEAILWVQQGDAGAVHQVTYAYPVGNYPVTDELLVSWVLAASQRLGAAGLWAPGMVALAATAAVTGLRRARADLITTALAVASVVGLPLWARLLIGPHNDLGALTWLLCAVVLAAAARSVPGLLVPALLAAGLSIGTKTTTAPMLVAAGLFIVRPPFPRARLLTAALVVAGVVGGLSYVRNLFVHGSPLWPFLAWPHGDPLPRIYAEAGDSFLHTVRYSLSDGRLGRYFDAFAGGPFLLAAAPLAALFVRRRRVAIAAVVSVLGVLVWAQAPFTGRPEDPLLDFTFGTLRYLVPALAVAVLTLALAATDGGPRVRRAVLALLAACTAVSVGKALALGYPDVPSARTLLVGAAAGWLLAWRWRRWAPAAAALALACLYLLYTDHFAAHQARNPDLRTSGAIGFVARTPGFEASADPVRTAPATLAPLAGDRLDHELGFLPERVDCARVRALRGWIVLGTPPPTRYVPSVTAVGCLAGVRPAYDDGRYRVYDRRR